MPSRLSLLENQSNASPEIHIQITSQSTWNLQSSNKWNHCSSLHSKLLVNTNASKMKVVILTGSSLHENLSWMPVCHAATLTLNTKARRFIGVPKILWSFSRSVSHDGGWEMYFLGYIMEGKQNWPRREQLQNECRMQNPSPRANGVQKRVTSADWRMSTRLRQRGGSISPPRWKLKASNWDSPRKHRMGKLRR